MYTLTIDPDRIRVKELNKREFTSGGLHGSYFLRKCFEK